MKKLLITAILSAYIVSSFGQFSVIQDAEGETSYQLLGTNMIAVNAAATSLGFSLQPKKITNKNTSYWTITSSAATKNGIANILKAGSFQFSGQLGGTYIWDKTDYSDEGNGNLLYQFLGAELIYSRYNVFDSVKHFDDQLYYKGNLGVRVNYGWNFENVKIDVPVLRALGEFTSGISASIGLKDNSDVIDQNEIITSTSMYRSNDDVRYLATTDNAYEKGALTANKLFGRFNFDFGKHLFKRRVLANLHLNYAMDNGYKSVLNPAFGLFITAPGAPMEAVFGIQLQTSDYSNARKSEKSRGERTSLVLTAGFPFN